MNDDKQHIKTPITNFDFSITIKFVFLFLIIFIVSIAIYYFAIHKPASSIYTCTNIENTVSNEPIYETSETVSTKKSLVVKGANYLEITGVYINSDNPKRSTVSIKIKNNSNEAHENIELSITLLDKNDKTITTLDCKIDNIEPNEETVTYTALMEDLSSCVNYFITIKKFIFD